MSRVISILKQDCPFYGKQYVYKTNLATYETVLRNFRPRWSSTDVICCAEDICTHNNVHYWMNQRAPKAICWVTADHAACRCFVHDQYIVLGKRGRTLLCHVLSYYGYQLTGTPSRLLHIPSSLSYKSHFSRQLNCWSLRCSWSIACRRCSNYIFILNLTSGFNGLSKDNYKTRRETFKFWDLVRLILEILR